ncbi:hypothetical protein KG892_05260 [Vermiphilus pyriformis]|nr:MAG: hypothetical protein KG892_05260 [Vermiphilus pyriformis]
MNKLQTLIFTLCLITIPIYPVQVGTLTLSPDYEPRTITAQLMKQVIGAAACISGIIVFSFVLCKIASDKDHANGAGKALAAATSGSMIGIGYFIATNSSKDKL